MHRLVILSVLFLISCMGSQGSLTRQDRASVIPPSHAVQKESFPATQTLERWFLCFNHPVSSLELERRSPLSLGQPIYTRAGTNDPDDSQALTRGTYHLSLDLPFLFDSHCGQTTVELGGPDSFVDLADLTTRAVYRIVSIGPIGYVLDAKWISDTSIAVITVHNADIDNCGADGFTLQILLFDLGSMTKSVYSSLMEGTISEEAVLACVAASHDQAARP